MRIKVAILDKDQSYLSRIVSVFGARYAEKLQIYSFTEKELAIGTLDSARVDVFLVSDAFEIAPADVPKRCALVYFVDSADIDSLNDCPAICKFQKAEQIYKQLLSIYSENVGNKSGIKGAAGNTKVFVFSSPCGGTGTSSVAAGCAVHFARKGKRTLYLNLEKYGSSDVFFSAEGQFDMSDIIYALKSKKANLPLKLESCLKQDHSGVYFYSQPKVALDMLELKADDILRLINELNILGIFDYIIIDADFSLDKDSLRIYKNSSSFVMVSNGSKEANSKIIRAYVALGIMEQNDDDQLLRRACVAYNKFSNKTGETLTNLDVRILGGAPRYDHATTAQVLEQLANMNLFDSLD